MYYRLTGIPLYLLISPEISLKTFKLAKSRFNEEFVLFAKNVRHDEISIRISCDLNRFGTYF